MWTTLTKNCIGMTESQPIATAIGTYHIQDHVHFICIIAILSRLSVDGAAGATVFSTTEMLCMVTVLLDYLTDCYIRVS